VWLIRWHTSDAWHAVAQVQFVDLGVKNKDHKLARPLQKGPGSMVGAGLVVLAG
jgi:hypothetical protein